MDFEGKGGLAVKRWWRWWVQMGMAGGKAARKNTRVARLLSLGLSSGRFPPQLR